MPSPPFNALLRLRVVSKEKRFNTDASSIWMIMLESRICIAWWEVKTGTKRGMTGGSWRLNTENVQRLDRTLWPHSRLSWEMEGSSVLLWVHHWLLDGLSEASQALGTPCHLRLSPFRNHVLAPVIWNQFSFSPHTYWCTLLKVSLALLHKAQGGLCWM